MYTLCNIMDWIYLEIKPIYGCKKALTNYFCYELLDNYKPEKILAYKMASCTGYAVLMKHLAEKIGVSVKRTLMVTDSTSHEVITTADGKVFDPTLNVYYDKLSEDANMYYHERKVTVDDMLDKFGKKLPLIEVDLLLNPYTRWRYCTYSDFVLSKLLKGKCKVTYV